MYIKLTMKQRSRTIPIVAVATITTSGSWPSRLSQTLGFTNNSGGGRSLYSEIPDFLLI